MSTLVLLRHGESAWNEANVFTGWIDGLSERGRRQAEQAGALLAARGYRVRPPLGEADDGPRYAALPAAARPRGESLHDVTLRLLPYWYDAVIPDLGRHERVLVVSHGNTLRALVKRLEAVSDEESSRLNVPNASPLCYEFRAGQPGRATRLAT